ncbi:MAG TPA: LysE family transporter [Actinomycetes bacterium]
MGRHPAARRVDRPMTSPALTALAIGVALAGAPGPVQAVLVAEAIQGGVARGLRALAGVHLTFAALLVCLALGVSVAAPRGPGLRLLRAAGGVLLLWLAADGLRAKGPAALDAGQRRSLPPGVRGVLAILLNPGGWLFLAAVASPLLTAAQRGGTTSVLVAAGTLVLGAALGDVGLVLLAGLGLRFATDRVLWWSRVVLAGVLAVFGGWLLVSGARPST